MTVVSDMRGRCGLKKGSPLLQGQVSSKEESTARKHRDSSGCPTKAALFPKQDRFGGKVGIP